MLIFPDAGLVYLGLPKTGTMAVRAMLRRVAWKGPPMGRHMGLSVYRRRVAPALEDHFGRRFETLCAVREPVDRLRSWFHYRQRDKVAGKPESTHGLSFDAFVAATMERSPPECARVGRQDVFVGWDGAMAGIDHLFDYARLHLMVDFLAGRLGLDLTLPVRNVSAPGGVDSHLSAQTTARLAEARAGEFALYRAVAEAGHLRRISSSEH